MKIMRYYNILCRKIIYAGILLLCVLITGTLNAQDQKEKKAKQLVEVSLKVVDENGTAISKAQVVVGEGIIHAETDENGSVSFKAYADDFVGISAPGYEKSTSLVGGIMMNNSVKLIKSKLFMTTDDDIPLPFVTLKKRFTTGSSDVITGEQLEKYPSSDIRNAFTGLSPGLEVIERYTSPGFSAEERNGSYRITEKVGLVARGRTMNYIIDDVFIDATEMPLDPQEIESVTVITDIIGKAMFGPAGADGIMYIKTKRGKANERILNVNIEGGVSSIDRMPGWASGAEYATLRNLARTNDNLTTGIYSPAAIEGYAKNDPYDKKYPSADFRELLLKDSRPYRRANVSSSGGNDAVQYSAYLGYTGEGDIFKIGAISDYNRVNTRSNIDIRVNKAINVQFDISASLSYRRSPNYGYSSTVGEGGSQMDLMEMSSAISDIITIPPVAFPIYASSDPVTGVPWYGVSTSYPNNPVGNISGNGDYNETGRSGSANFVFNYDLSDIVKGLRSKTLVGINALDLLRIGKAENYFGYIVTPSTSVKTGNDTILLTLNRTGVFTPNLSNLHDYYYQRYAFYENLTYDRSFDKHSVQSTLTYYMYKVAKNGYTETQRQQNLIWTGKYSFNDKYSIQGVLNYAGTYTLDDDVRFKLFPSVGASWIISEEGFMSGLKFINYLKLRANAGILGNETFRSPFYYRDSYTYNSSGTPFGPNSTGQWFGSNRDATVYRNYPSRVGNPALDWETRKEFSAGLDALMFSQKLSLEVSYYNNLREGEVVRIVNSLPYVAGVSAAMPYVNYNNTRYIGVETGIQFTDNVGKFVYSVGGNASIQNSKYERYDEPAYRYAYQSRTGKATDTYWGQTFLGKFGSDAEALTVPQLYDAVLKTGDLKYQDMNGDGVVDDNDMSAVGHTSPRLIYSVNAKFSYKNFDLTIIGTGRAMYDLPLTNTYFWNGWGDNNYSDFVKDNIDGAYPRLTYNKVNNNFVSSDFWLVKGDFFKIQNVELAYNLSPEISKVIRARGIRLFVRGANLLTISSVKDVDPESINSGVTTYPLYKTFTGGIKLTF
jgi:TonB-linked SusC/RagA family outer membrane protein